MIQPKMSAGAESNMSPGVEAGIQALRGGGQSMSESERRFFEPRFGIDFSPVRLHRGFEASRLSRAVHARAFTIGNDIVLGEEQQPQDTSEGRKLLAHELTHVIQQRQAVTPKMQRQTNPLSDMTTFQSPGATGWRGAIWGCYRNGCARKHKGWDIHAATGTECKAAVAGTTAHASQGTNGYGDYVVLTSSADATKKYYYAHLSSRETAGTVAEGAKVGETGTTGNASASRPHLHFTVKESGTKVDPDGKGFTKPTQVIEASGSTATTINFSEPEPCSPCSM